MISIVVVGVADLADKSVFAFGEVLMGAVGHMTLDACDRVEESAAIVAQVRVEVEM